MRVSKVFAFVFGILGTALMLLTVLLCLTSLNGEVRMTQAPEAALDCTEQLMACLAEGDYPGAEKQLYGDARLGDPREAAGEEGKLVWRAFADSFAYTFAGGCYGAENGLCRDVTITTLDIPSISTSLEERAQAVLHKKVEDAREVNNMNLVYEEDGTVKEAVLNSVIETALTQALAENAKTLTTTVKLQLVNEDGVWQVVPTTELLKAVSGGL